MLRAVLQRAESIARGSGAVLLEGWQRVRRREPIHTQFKSSPFDPVTEYDHRSEAFIVAALRDSFPDHCVVGEEGGDYRTDCSARLQWQIDPLDGTVNFSHGFPCFAVSLGLLLDGEPILGVVYDPVHDELFAAARGLGATLNGQPILVSETAELSRSLLSTGFPYQRACNPRNNIRECGRFVLRAQELRRMGSAALDLCWVACGRTDGYWELDVRPHDIAAGIVMVREAGGQVSDTRGGLEMLARGEVVASNGRIHQAMLRLLQSEEDLEPVASC